MDSNIAHTDFDGIDPTIYKRRWLILATVCLALLGVMLANCSINLALPRMSADLGLSQLEQTWIVNIYSLLVAGLLFLAGACGDRYGRKLALQIGSLAFAASAFYAGFLAHSAIELIIARGIMGLGSALVMPTTLSIVNNIFPTKERVRAIAIWSAITGIGMMLGGVMGGILMEYIDWNSIFYLSAAIAAVSLVINQVIAPESRDEKGLAVDWIGGIFAAVGIFGLVYGITEAPSKGILDGTVLAGLLIGIASLAVFVVWERRSVSPLLDMNLFHNRAFTVSSLTLTLAFLAMSAIFFTISQLQQLILGMSPLTASLLMLPIMLPFPVMAPVIPRIVEKIGNRSTIVTGLALITISFLVISAWTIDTTYLSMLPAMIVMITGVSLAMTPSTNILMASVPKNRSGMGSAMNDTTRELGCSLGVALFGAILSAVYVSNITEVSGRFSGSVKTSLETSLATALNTAASLGPDAGTVADAARVAWMHAFSIASLVAAGIVFVTMVIALMALPRQKLSENDTHE
jgi:EmrB/QacA subfamily drug resistance transporter